MAVRSTTKEFGLAVAATAQTYVALASTAFGRQIFEPSIDIEGDPVVINPVANATRPTRTRKSLKSAKVAYKEPLVPGATAIVAPAFFDSLAASGFVITTTATTSVATLGAVPSNDKDTNCELFDGIHKTWAWGVRGVSKIVAENPGERLMLEFNGIGHGSRADQTAWPAGVVDDLGAGAIFEDNGLTIGAWVPEAARCSFDLEGDPIKLGNGLAADGFTEPWLKDTQAFLRFTAYKHALAAMNWDAMLDDLASNSNTATWTVPFDADLEMVITGNVMLYKRPNAADLEGVGTFPLEFQFTRLAPITITVQERA